LWIRTVLKTLNWCQHWQWDEKIKI
jgi:hypothetical protein